MATIKQIAQHAGVSVATVSHVINNTRYVSDEVRARVEASIREFNYVPNAVARSLRCSDTKTLGMMIPNSSNPFFAEVVRGVEDECFRHGYSLILCNSDDNRDKQSIYLRALMSKRIDGLGMISSGHDEDLQALLSSTSLPLVIVDREIDNISADLVELNHQQGCYLAVKHLVELGHKRIAYLSGPADLTVSQQRLRGVQQALSEAGLVLQADHLVTTDLTSHAGFTCTQQLMQLPTPPTALFAGNDLVALGAICAIHEAGKTVPGDFSVIGFDDIALASYMSPRLTTVHQPTQRIGQLTAQLLIERITGTRQAIRHEILTPELRIRHTTAKPSCQ